MIELAHDDGRRRPPTVVAIDRVSQRFGAASARRRDPVEVVRDVSLEVAAGEIVCIVGASGCGKSTLLDLVAGLTRPTAGTVRVDGRVAFMFQDSALAPWKTARENVELALRWRGVPRRRRPTIALELLDVVHLRDAADRRPHELSGGMRQRVALARSLAQDADVLLMDEPFGALDAITRQALHDELERLVTDTGTAVVFVTHDVVEAVRLGDRVVLLAGRPGRIAGEFAVPLARPRRVDRSADAAAIGSIAAQVTERLRAEHHQHVGRPCIVVSS
jgi:NitT/TauT family transport system ATP-binding protein